MAGLDGGRGGGKRRYLLVLSDQLVTVLGHGVELTGHPLALLSHRLHLPDSTVPLRCHHTQLSL